MVVQPEVEGFVDRSAVEGRKRRRDGESLCEVVTRKRIRKAVHDPQGNEYVIQTKGRYSGRL